MRGVWTQWARAAVIGALATVLALAAGCRKSRTEQEKEERERQSAVKESEAELQERTASNRQQYDEAKELIAQRKYDEAWAKFEEVAARDKEIEFEFDIYKNERLPTQLFDVADKLAAIKPYQFNPAYRQRVANNFSEAMRTLVFVRDHIEKKRNEAEKRIKTLRKLKAADDRYYGGLQLIEQYRRAEGIRLLEEVRDNYQDTPYYDLAIKKLVELQPREEGPPR